MKGNPDKINYRVVFLGLLLIFLSLLIYVFFRNTDQIIAFRLLGVNYGTFMPLENNFIKFYLIDFLFYLGFMLLVKGIYLYILTSWFILLEFLQIFFNIGTFDLIDILMIIASLLIVRPFSYMLTKSNSYKA